MATRRHIQKKRQSNFKSTPATGMFKSRSFAEPTTPDATVQAKVDSQPPGEAARGDRLSHIEVSPPSAIQPKLAIGAPGDKYEQEADTVARKVVKQISAPTPPDPPPNGGDGSVQRQMFSKPSIRRLTVQRREAIEGGEASSDLERTISQAKSSGVPLAAPIRRQMEGAFGADFGGVRVHTNSTADTLNRSLSARAFTTGNNIFFKKGEYNPQSSTGKELLAHELTHVVQQGGSNLQRLSSQQAIATQAAPQISRSPENVIQRLLWTSDQFDKEIADKVKRTFYTPTVSKISQQILAKLRSYETVYLKKGSSLFMVNKSQVEEQRIKEIKEIVRLVAAARDVSDNAETKTKFTNFEESLLQELNGLEARKKGDRGTISTQYITNYAEYLYEQVIYPQIFSKISYKLGLGRRAWLRSSDLNEFRNSLKQAARSQAYADIDTVVEQELNAAKKNSTDAAKSYYGKQAKVEAYTTAKRDAVDEVIKDLAREITEQFAPKKKVFKEFSDSLQLVDPNDVMSSDKEKKILDKQAEEIVKKYVGVTKGKSASPAIAYAREIAKGSSVYASEQRDELVDKVTQVTTENKIGQKALQKVIQEDSLTKGFSRLAKLIDFAVPDPGDSCEVDIRIQVPIYGGSYFVTQVKGSAEKGDEGEVETGLEVSMGAGWSAVGIGIDLQFGAFFNSSAKTSDQAIGLISYGFYRKVQHIDASAAARVWGAGGEKIDKVEGQKNLAESWGAMMEEWLFYERDAAGNIIYEDVNGQKVPKINEDATVEIGWFGKGSGRAKVGDNGGEFEAQRLSGTKFSAETLGKNALGKTSKTPEQMAKLLKGQQRRTVKLKFAAELKALDETAGEVEVSVVSVPNPQGAPVPWSSRVLELEVALASKISAKVNDSAIWKRIVAGIITSLSAAAKKGWDYCASQDQKNQSSTAKDLGRAETGGIDYGAMLASASLAPEKEIEEELSRLDSIDTGFEFNQILELGATYQFERKDIGQELEHSIELAVKRGREIGMNVGWSEVGGVKSKIESKVTLVKYQKKW
ncbi:eCIS core domain-containing protein [Phormidium sp. CCY1219]|uniref:eCIS core domain-containing protein n=1 Tax=Phormidium sp. CCY1219 TaxID=2886104 RepID=UPI002D1E4E1B|nr:DUF4157 domain-containing protein [Phormidium sp. CCY1219]MEB3828429.1 DUF4157 domain-containing protein [Phormidium sp. CCY1219]